MKKLKVYSYAKCSTCRKALRFLESKQVPFEVIDITEQPPTTAELRKALASYEGDIRKLFNTSGVQYRELGLSSKIKGMSAAEAVAMLAKNGRLVKRPFVAMPEGGLVGFDEKQWKSSIK